MNASLLGYIAAVLAGLDDQGRQAVADDLGAIERAASDAALRAALTDTSVAAGARRSVLADVLADKVSAPAARIAAYAAFSSPAQDVPSSLNEAALRARAAVDAPDADEPALSVGASRRRVGGFADALFEELPTDGLLGVEDELFVWARAVESTPTLRAALTNRDLTAERRAGVVDTLLRGRASDVTLRLATYAVIGGRARDLVGTLDWLVDRVAAERGWRVARVRTARPIDEATQVRLAESLQSLSGRPVELEIAQQQDLLGGVLVEVGDLRVDATMRRRLEALREHLTLDRRTMQSFDETTQGVS